MSATDNNKYSLCGILNPFGRYPTFLVPIFERNGTYYLQDTSQTGVIDRFVACEIEYGSVVALTSTLFFSWLFSSLAHKHFSWLFSSLAHKHFSWLFSSLAHKHTADVHEMVTDLPWDYVVLTEERYVSTGDSYVYSYGVESTNILIDTKERLVQRLKPFEQIISRCAFAYRSEEHTS